MLARFTTKRFTWRAPAASALLTSVAQYIWSEDAHWKDISQREKQAGERKKNAAEHMKHFLREIYKADTSPLGGQYDDLLATLYERESPRCWIVTADPSWFNSADPRPTLVFPAKPPEIDANGYRTVTYPFVRLGHGGLVDHSK
jgi:hypothetical protein